MYMLLLGTDVHVIGRYRCTCYCCLQRFCADVVSVLGMTMSEGRECLKYRLLGSHEHIGSWGHEYVRLVDKLMWYERFNIIFNDNYSIFNITF